MGTSRNKTGLQIAKNSLSPDKSARKHQVLSQNKASITRGISDALVIKDSDIFFLSEPNSSVPLEHGHGLGFYYHDHRFLNAYEMRLAGTVPDVLMANVSQGFKAIFELTNREIDTEQAAIAKENIGIKLERALDGTDLTLCDTYTMSNFSR